MANDDSIDEQEPKRGFKTGVDPIFIFGGIVFAILVGIFVRVSHDNTNHGGLIIYVP